MIEYKQLEKTSEFPADVELITDDANAEMASLETMIKECGFEIELPQGPDQDSKFHVVIPGAMVGEFSESVWDIDEGKLDDLTDEWNDKILKATEDRAAENGD